MVAYLATQKALSDLPYEDDMNRLQRCIGVLNYYLRRDNFAQSFRDTLNNYLLILQDHKQSNTSNASSSATPFPSISDFVFDIRVGVTTVHSAAHDLLSLIHRPFSGLERFHVQKTLVNPAEISLGTHLG